MAGGFKRIGGGSQFLVSSFKNVLMTYDIGTAPVGGRGPGELKPEVFMSISALVAIAMAPGHQRHAYLGSTLSTPP